MHSVSLPKPPTDRPQELRITVAIGAAVIVQTAFGLIWAGAASERLVQLEKRAGDNAQMIERTARLEEQMSFVAATLVRIEKKIDAQREEG
jgi:hypothetical protein